MYCDQPVHELVSVSAGILLREPGLDLVIRQPIQISSIDLIERLPALLRPLNVLGSLYGPETMTNHSSDISQLTNHKPLEPARPHHHIVDGGAVDIKAKLPDKLTNLLNLVLVYSEGSR